MGKTATRSTVNSKLIPASVRAPAPSTRTQPGWLVSKLVKPLASLRLTVILFVLAIALVFFGTLAQVDEGIFTVLHRYFRSLVAWIPFQALVRFGQVFFGVSKSFEASGSFPFPGGWLIGGLMLVNLLAAHVVRFKLTWKRSGILLIHSGLVVMMLGELVTGLWAVESKMTIAVGEKVNFVDVSNEVELAIIDPSDSKTDDVFVIPGSMLRRGGLIQNGKLPVDVEVVDYMKNSAMQFLRPGAEQTGDVFTTLENQPAKISGRPEGSGVDSEAREDYPSVRVAFRRKGSSEVLASKLLSLWFYPNATQRIYLFPQQSIEVDGKHYTVSLRPKRIYKPYSITLKEFHHGVYPGTDIAKDFTSTVELSDPARHEDREAKVYMNNPLNYGWDTFYQSGYFPDNRGTILQVVRNYGRAMPYIACAMVALGMLVHFGIHLLGFLRVSLPKLAAPQATGLARYVPWMVLGGFAAYLAAVMAPPAEIQGMDLQALGKVPVQDRGRVKPLDTVARTSLLVISNRETFIDETGKDKVDDQPAIKWLLDVMSGGDFSEQSPAYKHKVFRIENIQVLDLLGLPHRPGSWRYSLAEIAPKFADLRAEAERVEGIDEKKRDLFDTKVAELWAHLQLFLGLNQLRAPAMVPPSKEGSDWTSLGQVEESSRRSAFERMRADAERTGTDLGQMPEQKLFEKFRAEIDKARAELPRSASMLTAILDDYRAGKPDQLNQAVADYRQWIGTPQAGPATRAASKAALETFFNQVAPFYQCSILSVLVFLVGVIGFLTSAGSSSGGRSLIRAAFWLALFTLCLHTAALITRMYLQGRPPVTNLYSAAVWISWGCVGLGLILEAIYRNGIGTIVAAVPGALSMILAHHLAGSGDTMEMLQAVLDTNFWLATHVTVVTFGYVATVVAGFLGILYVLLADLTKLLNRDLGRVVNQMTYAVVCFALLLSFTGTVLGGLWADVSWGRFWGWDPKENGALIVVLWNAVILHARWAGLVKQRGFAILSIAGIMVTGWSFIGTNQLGIGLHAYGFNNTLAQILVWTWAACCLLILEGCLPVRSWSRLFSRSDSLPSAQV
jgi:ABC-type transport system involved in cytochrome c biogenesis permease subunit